MNTLWLSSLSEDMLQQAKASPDFFEFMINNKELYRTSFEHNCYEHLDFLERQNLFSTRFGCPEVANGIHLMDQGTVQMYAKRLNYVDLNELKQKADQNLGERHDSVTFMQVIESRLIPILNYSARHQYYLTLDFG